MPSESSRHSLPPGLAAWLQQVCLQNRQFEEVQPQVCGAVSKAEEEELCSKQLELVLGKLSHPGVSASTMADCMVCIILHSIAFVKILSRNLSGADHPYGTFGL